LRRSFIVFNQQYAHASPFRRHFGRNVGALASGLGNFWGRVICGTVWTEG
jgi:hypothetical protein